MGELTPEEKKLLGEKIRELREKRGFSQEELGVLIGKTRDNISSYEIGRSAPQPDTLIKLADLFKVSIDYLLGRTDDPHQIFTTNEEMSPEQKHVVFRITEMIKEDMPEEDLASAVEFFEFLEARNRKRKNK